MKGWTAEDYKTLFEGIAALVTAILAGLAALRSHQTANLVRQHEEASAQRTHAMLAAVEEGDRPENAKLGRDQQPRRRE